MNTRLKTRLLVLLAAAILGPVMYLLSLGHCFLPLTRSANYQNEKLEMREYGTFVIPSTARTIPATLKRVTWQITNPGRARLLATSERLEGAAPNQNHTLQEVLEAMGYDFPPGCVASAGDSVPHWRISHYPSMLRRIEKDLSLTAKYKESLDQDDAPLPNAQRGANGSQPFSSQTNRTSPTAAPRRSP